MSRLLLLALLLAASRPSATDLPAGAWQRIEPDHSRTTAAPSVALRVPSLPANGKRAAPVGTQPAAQPPAAFALRGQASWFAAPDTTAAAGPALRAALGRSWRGSSVLVTGPAGSAVVVLRDWMRRDRLVDLSAGSFVRVCGPLSKGVCRVTVGSAPRPPETSTE